jgi:WD40 repeat protein
VRRWGEIHPSKVNTTLLMFGLALLIAVVAGPHADVDGTKIGPGASGEQRAIVLLAGLLSVIWSVLASWEPARVRWLGGGFLGERPPLPLILVERPYLRAEIVRAVRAGERPVAVTGIGGAGKSILAAQACSDRLVRRRFRHGIIWLDAGSVQDPVALLADLARRLGLADAAAGFTTMGQGREKLMAVLRRKRVLVAVDNVQGRGPLDALIGLAPKGTVVFTTRVAGLANTVGATPVRVDKLTQEQSMELLCHWAGQAPAALPDTARARALCTRVGNLALGVAMAGAMAAGGRSFADVLALIEQDLARLQADLYPKYPYPTLPAAITAGITSLPEDSRRRYAQLAVFAGRGSFPRDAARALWQPELSETDVIDLLAELVGQSLLTVAREGWYIAHDLQYATLASRLGKHGLAVANARLLEGYRSRYPGGWAGSAADPYLARTLAGHLRDAGLGDELRAVLTDAAWIETRLACGQLADLIVDYRDIGDPLTAQILRALRMSAPALAADPAQVCGQLVGRLMCHPEPAIAAWAVGLTRHGGRRRWLAPLTPALTPTTDPLQQILTGHKGWVRSVAVTADGATAVVGGGDGMVHVWDLAAGRERAKLTGHQGRVLAVAVAGDGSTAVTGGGDGVVHVWDLATGRERVKFAGHVGGVLAVAVTADGSRAVTGGKDGMVRMWDLAVGHEWAKVAGHEGWVLSVAVTAEGSMAVTSGMDGVVRVWDLAAGHERAKLAERVSGVRSVAVTADGSTAVVGGADGVVRVWDLAAGHERVKLTGHKSWVQAVAVTADGSTAVVGGADGVVRVWDLAAGRERAKLTGHQGRVLAVAVAGDGSTAVTGGGDGVVRIWDLAVGRERATFTGHVGGVLVVAVTADGSAAVTGGKDGVVRVWDLTAGHERAQLAGHVGGVLAAAVTSDGATAVTGGEDGVVRAWDLAAGRERATFTGHKGRVLAVAVAGDGSTAVAGGENEVVRVWDLAGGRERAQLAGHVGGVLAVAVTADGSTAVTGGKDGVVRMWDLIAGSQVARWDGDHPIIGCMALSCRPLRIAIGQQHGPPYLLELIGQDTALCKRLAYVDLTG